MANYHHGGRAMYSNTDDECYDAVRQGGSMRAHLRTNEHYDKTQDVRVRGPTYVADCGYNGGSRRAMYSNTDDECYNAVRHGGSMRAQLRTNEHYDNMQDVRVRGAAYTADGGYNGGSRRAMYSNTNDESYDAVRHGGSMRAHQRTDEHYDNMQDVRVRGPAYAADRGYNGGGRAMYSNTDDEYYDAARHGGSMRAYLRTDEHYDNMQDARVRGPAYAAGCGYNGVGYGGRQSAEYSRGGYGHGGEQDHFKRERDHKHKKRIGVACALAGGAFALYEAHRAKEDPENADRHMIEARLAAELALGAGRYAYHELNEQKEASYEAKHQEHRGLSTTARN